jgi:hypothetical protein
MTKTCRQLEGAPQPGYPLVNAVAEAANETETQQIGFFCGHDHT